MHRPLSAPAMIRPFTAMGEVHCRTPGQVSLLVNTGVPVAPARPVSGLLLMIQTIGSECPSVVVTMGVGADELATILMGAHHSTWGAGGAPAGSSTDMSARPFP